ncbi:MAG: septal ring lytic transglycosylase RlpA family protein [Leptolyngbyaceae cyanobacterium]
MNQKILGSLTATLLITTLGIPQIAQAQSSQPLDSKTSSKASITPQNNLEIASRPIFQPDLSLTTEVVKIGEQPPSPASNQMDESIAKVHSFTAQGRKAAILYVRNIPVLKFLSATQAATSSPVKMGTQMAGAASNSAVDQSSQSFPAPAARAYKDPDSVFVAVVSDETRSTSAAPADEPTWQASEVATRINQLNQAGLDGSRILVKWDSQSPKNGDRYLITVENQVLVTVTQNVRLPDTTRNLAEDALQAANRLRRTLGNANPLSEVSGMPQPKQQVIAIGPIRLRLNGWASWYGPGLHGNPSASGEPFNQHDLTAAHRTLPFGTRVQVTNLDNGRTVVVRINDRGPFHGNRIIDISTAAARILGLVQSGVAPVRLDVVDDRGVPISSR